ncbi:RcpC/CpaB family pilus assembly protein [Aneurinibacillus migulanus]|uniref:Flp pilus assembly protein CpaB n=1 Tax=Aneurinibacillus migulanus TaxID=47500 RepID=UPI002E1FA2D0|nr:RcpC/CpaB family pilus assembly protein [Aneurinibacillus migulanus]
MNKKNKRIILSTVGAVVGTLLIFSSVTPSEAPVKLVKAYELKSDVKTDKKITENDIQQIDVAETEVKNWMVRDPKEVVGKYAKVDMYSGEKIRKDRLADKEVLSYKPDERTMNIEVGLARSAGIPKPGDRVDIIAGTQKGKDENAHIESKLLLQNVYIARVLTKDAQDTKEPTAEDKDTRNLVPAIVTVKVTVPQAVVLDSYTGNEKVKLRLLGRTYTSENVQ